MALVFQYGSNTLESEVNSTRRMNGRAQYVDMAQTVEPYELTFDVFSTKRKCATSNIIPANGNKRVWGVLYEVPEELLGRKTAPSGSKSFDEIEGENINHRRHCIRVKKRNGDVVSALTYVTLKPKKRLKRTSFDYVQLIISGLREHQVPATYIDEVKKSIVRHSPRLARKTKDL